VPEGGGPGFVVMVTVLPVLSKQKNNPERFKVA